MPSSSPDQPQASPFQALAMGFLGVLGFSFTLPASRLAVASFDPLIVGPGRALIAACLAGPLLLFTRQKRPTLLQWRCLAVMVLGVIIGFPGLTSWAMRHTPASHGAVEVATATSSVTPEPARV